MGSPTGTPAAGIQVAVTGSLDAYRSGLGAQNSSAGYTPRNPGTGGSGLVRANDTVASQALAFIFSSNIPISEKNTQK